MPSQAPSPGVRRHHSSSRQLPSQRGETKQPLPSQTYCQPGVAAHRASLGRATHVPPRERQALLQSPCSKHAVSATSLVAPPGVPHQ